MLYYFSQIVKGTSLQTINWLPIGAEATMVGTISTRSKGMRHIHPGVFRNIDNRRVLDDEGRQGIDGITGLGSDTEVVCGRLIEQLLRIEPFLSTASLNDYIDLTYRLKEERAAGKFD